MRLLHLLKKVLFPAYSAVIVVPRVQGPKACKFHEDNYNCSSDVVRKAFMKISENSVEHNIQFICTPQFFKNSFMKMFSNRSQLRSDNQKENIHFILLKIMKQVISLLSKYFLQAFEYIFCQIL